MRDRIKKIMDAEQLTPSAFADRLDIGRAVMSHILNGRNNPSLDVVTRILSEMDYINSDWLLTGKGAMYKKEVTDLGTDNISNEYLLQQSQSMHPKGDLFSGENLYQQNTNPQIVVNPSLERDNLTGIADKFEYRQQTGVNEVKIDTNKTENQIDSNKKQLIRKISKIIIYYDDNTFETFDPDKKAF